MRIDEPIVDRGQVLPGQMKFLKQRLLIIGDEHVGRAHEANKRLAPLRPPEVQRDTFLVPAGKHPAPVKLRPGDTRELRIDPPKVAAARPLYLDHFGTKVRHNGSRRRPRNIGPTINNPNSGKQTTVIHYSNTSSTMLT